MHELLSDDLLKYIFCFNCVIFHLLNLESKNNSTVKAVALIQVCSDIRSKVKIIIIWQYSGLSQTYLYMANANTTLSPVFVRCLGKVNYNSSTLDFQNGHKSVFLHCVDLHWILKQNQLKTTYHFRLWNNKWNSFCPFNLLWWRGWYTWRSGLRGRRGVMVCLCFSFSLACFTFLS